MALYAEEAVPFQQTPNQHKWGDQIRSVLQANYRCSLRRLCSGAILACIIITWYGFSGWMDDASKSAALVDEIRVDTSGISPVAFVAKALTCCAQGSGGMPGICLQGDPNGICCGSELALLCGAGSSCYTNAQGNPYCCGKHTSGCAHVCLDNFTRDNYISRGGVCNPVSPQGFNADGTILYVDAPWDGYRMSYLSDGTLNITFVNPPIQLGARDFTMTITLIPRNDSVFGYQTIGEQRAVLINRIEMFPNGTLIGYSIDMRQLSDSAVLSFALYRNAPEGGSTNPFTGSFQIAEFFLSVPIRADIPISLRFIRQGFNLTAFRDNVRLRRRRRAFNEEQAIDVDTDLNAPLTISPRNPFSERDPVTDEPVRRDFVGSIRDLSIISAAELP